jgi:FMN-dependent NADH-azoreductase
MKTLLYIKSSPRKGSYSASTADAFVSAYQAANPSDKVVAFDVFKADLPAFDGDTLDAKYAVMRSGKPEPQQVAAWKRIEQLIADFKAADKYVFAVPMWNFGIPYRLKQFIDIIVQPGYTFTFTPETGYKGLVTGKPALVVYARGGEYAEGTQAANIDFQKRYLDFQLGFIGFTEIKTIVVEPTLAGDPAKIEEIKNSAIAKAMAIAGNF